MQALVVGFAGNIKMITMKKIIFLLLFIPILSFGQDGFEVLPVTDNYLENSTWIALKNTTAGRVGYKISFKGKTPVGKRQPHKKAVMHHTYVDYNYYYNGVETNISNQYLNYNLSDGFYLEPLARIQLRFLLNKTRDTLKIDHLKGDAFEKGSFYKTVYFSK